jgi:tetratricopeptide (TPR) repeat protein
VKARLQRLFLDRPMRILLSRAKPADPNFAIGLGLIMTLAAAEIFAATFYYLDRTRAARTSSQSVAMATVGRPAVSATPIEPHPRSSPATSIRSPELSAVDRLLQEAIGLRDRGDTATALARLNEASELDPNNAMVLEETAKTYESMQQFDRSNEAWRKLRDLGPSVGPLYELAARRLKFGVPSPSTATPGMAPESPGGASTSEAANIPEGSTFGISEINATETPDSEADKNLTLRIGIKKQTNAAIDHNKVRILVKFYDTVNDKEVKLTDADVNYEWLTAKHDWADANPEILSVNYLRPKARASSPDTELLETAAAGKSRKGRSPATGSSSSEKRKYLGYEIFLYYNDKLQAAQAEPVQLLKLYPPSDSTSSP